MIIVGLGNPGEEYDGTRHNIGFEVLDRLSAKHPGLAWKHEFGVHWARLDGHLLIKPQEFMNVSGPTVHRFLDKKKVTYTLPDLFVVHDDLDFPLGEVRQQADRSAAGHNGIQSLIDTFGAQDFQRLRIGIGDNRLSGVPAEDYVLQRFSPTERPVIDQAIAAAVETIERRLSSTENGSA